MSFISYNYDAEYGVDAGGVDEGDFISIVAITAGRRRFCLSSPTIVAPARSSYWHALAFPAFEKSIKQFLFYLEKKCELKTSNVTPNVKNETKPYLSCVNC